MKGAKETAIPALDGVSDLRARAIALYKPPFRYDGYGFIFDAQNEMMVDDVGEGMPVSGMVATLGATLQIRGWGRISYLPNAAALQDTVGELVAQALTEFWERQRDAGVPR